MNGYGSSEDHQPVMWLRGHAVYAAHFIVLVFVASMLVTTVMMFFGMDHLYAWTQFSSDRVLKGEAWRIFTYGLQNPRSIWFAIDMVMIGWFGRELERFFGRRIFLYLFGSLYLLSPLLFTLIGVWRPMSLAGESGSFALFIAFATLYPNVAFFFNILAKWLAVILVAIYTLAALASRDFVTLLSLWATVGFAYGFVRFQQGHFSLPRFRFPQGKPHLRVLPDLPAKKSPAIKDSNTRSMAEVDALLDKIAQSGMASLTPKERARLDAAREDLRKRTSGRP